MDFFVDEKLMDVPGVNPSPYNSQYSRILEALPNAPSKLRNAGISSAHPTCGENLTEPTLLIALMTPSIDCACFYHINPLTVDDIE